MAEIKVQLEPMEEEALERLVRARLFASRDEAARAAILKYALDLGLLDREELWAKLGEAHRSPAPTPEQLATELERLEEEVQ